MCKDLGQFSLGGKQLVDEPEYDPETLTDCAAPVVIFFPLPNSRITSIIFCCSQQLGRKLVDEGEYDPETMTDCAAPTIGQKKGLVDEDEYDPETMTDCADISVSINFLKGGRKSYFHCHSARILLMKGNTTQKLCHKLQTLIKARRRALA